MPTLLGVTRIARQTPADRLSISETTNASRAETRSRRRDESALSEAGYGKDHASLDSVVSLTRSISG